MNDPRHPSPEDDWLRGLANLPESSWNSGPAPGAESLVATLRVQARRRRLRRTLHASALLVAFALGLFAGIHHGTAPDTAPPDEAPLPSVSPRVGPPRLEQRGLTGSDERRALELAAAGDAYLQSTADLGDALRCYRKALELVPDLHVERPSYLLNALLDERRRPSP